ncbi:MAG TPA: 2-dehydropantoate 2-reductase [Dermatophilaceae bacterium]|mgnify:CR=1 FL=1|nr:2-dehydropantoate 2-reductase [Dermatophilaceae bacterium]
MQHAVIGAGGIGGLVAAVLATRGEQVSVVLRATSRAAYPGRLRLTSPSLGDLDVAVAAVARVTEPVDVLWVTVKAGGMTDVRDWVADPASVGLVVPLLNGVDHLAELRAVFPRVAGATISVEAERAAPGEIVQRTAFCRFGIAPPPGEQSGDGHPSVASIAGLLGEGGVTTAVWEDEATLMWSKLCFLGPVALATTAHDAPLGDIREHPDFRRCREEALAAARAAGAHVDEDAVRAAGDTGPGAMRSSMQKDVAAGRPPELDAIAGPILRLGATTEAGTRHTEALVAAIRQRLASASVGS